MSDLLLPLPQSPEFAKAATALGLPVRRMTCECAGNVKLVWQVQSRRFGVLGRIDLISRGPVAQRPEDMTHWLDSFHRWQDRRPLLLNADGLPSRALRDAGFWPLVTPSSLALLRLHDPATQRSALRQKWRNRLNKASSLGLKVRRVPVTPDHWLLEAEQKQSRARGYKGLPAALSVVFARKNPGKAHLWEVLQNGVPVAGLLMLAHGRMATWQIGHSTAQGRACHAMNLGLWHAMTWLAEQGHSLLDLGTINTQDAPGLAHFKLGTGADLHRLGGSWMHLGALAPIARHLPSRFAA